jgi:hypothetical protein
MFRFLTPVKFIRVLEKSGISKKTGNSYWMAFACLSVPDVGLVQVPIEADNPESMPKLPVPLSVIDLQLGVSQGSFQAFQAVWDYRAAYKAA